MGSAVVTPGESKEKRRLPRTSEVLLLDKIR